MTTISGQIKGAPFRTTHDLPFEDGGKYFQLAIDDGMGWRNFRVGTVHGLYTEKGGAYHILAIENRQPHNGHLEDMFQWFENSAQRDGFPLIIHAVMSDTMARILLRRGYLPVFGTENFKLNPPIKKNEH